jgi:hypothetical protein
MDTTTENAKYRGNILAAMMRGNINTCRTSSPMRTDKRILQVTSIVQHDPPSYRHAVKNIKSVWLVTTTTGTQYKVQYDSDGFF